ncbi:hypothetical protein HXX76_011988 [Chlamydomonas incerta]|uniref:C-CAP/cofactor C-like domain-containing protein n=1 Tax=Chlamydomonas incerta TaxID=51695 RepID=A0A835SIX1_CHLIN|nr:hypothetical protein HXX76_011988 [Chlamydomonas incerta]|eukprot:KAG2428002.1 hypothetical protein HXX76_011988 [Chlamydomonas incerta]
MSNPADFVFAKKTGEVLVKLPGSINGNGFKLDTLHDCEVYILDHTSQVQVDDCVNCKIFIGPTDGSVFIRDCRDCTLCVAARQLRTRDCTRLDIALYCATQPSIETSTDIKFSCWRGAYPGLAEHFSHAKLDPTKNTWMQVYDFNAKDDLGAPHYSLDDSAPAGGDAGWWLPPPDVLQQLAAPPECPVAAPDGSLYGGGRVEPPPPSPGGGGRQLPDSLPPSPGRAAAHDEEIELEDDPEECVPVLLEGEDGGRSFVMPAQPSPRRDPGDDVDGDGTNAFSFASPRATASSVPAAAAAAPLVAAGSGSGSVVPPPPLTMLGSGGTPHTSAPPNEGVASPSAAPLPLGGGDDAESFFGAAPPAPENISGANAEAAAAPLPPPAYAEEDFFFTPSAARTNGGAGEGGAGEAAAAGATGREPEAEDARVAWRAANAGRLKAVAAAESVAKDKLVAEARQRLAALQQGRTALLKQRFSTNRANGTATAATGGKPSKSAGGGWVAVAELVDPASGGGGAGASSGKAGGAGPAKDVARFKQMLLKLKTQQKEKGKKK